MKFYETKRDIAAPPGVVWAILTDAARLQGGGFGIIRIDRAITGGGRIKLWSEVAPGRAFALRITTFDPPHRMVWTGGMPLGLFSGVRSFALTSVGSMTRFHLREEFTGALLGLIWRSMPDLQPSFDTFADTLKSKAESA